MSRKPCLQHSTTTSVQYNEMLIGLTYLEVFTKVLYVFSPKLVDVLTKLGAMGYIRVLKLLAQDADQPAEARGLDDVERLHNG